MDVQTKWFVFIGFAMIGLAATPGRFVLLLGFPIYSAFAGVALTSKGRRYRFLVYALFPWLVFSLAFLLMGLTQKFGFGNVVELLLMAGPATLGAYGLGILTGKSARIGTVGIALLALGITAFGSFAANGFHCFFSLPLVLLFPAVCALALWQCRVGSSHVNLLCTLAVTLAFSAAWLGVWGNVESFDQSSQFSWKMYDGWLEEHGASTDYYKTRAVTGFPFQKIQGHGGGGACEVLPLTKGLDYLMLNFLMWLAVLFALVCALPKRFLVPVGWTAIALATVSVLLGWGKLLFLLD